LLRRIRKESKISLTFFECAHIQWRKMYKNVGSTL
jgi:hypothetical protein